MKKFTLAIVIMLVFFSALPVFAGGKKEEAVKPTETKAVEKKEPQFKIGIVFDIGGKGDKSFNDSAYNGLVLLAKNFSGYIKDDPDKVNFGDKIELKYLEPKAGGQDREQLLRVLAEDGYNLIFGVGFMFTDSIGKVAKDFPNVHFALIDGFIPDLTESSNITCLSFAEHEGSFLVGAVAGLLTKTNKVGFIGGMDIPLIHKFQGGYLAGAIYVNPKLRTAANLPGQYIGKDPSAFNDPKAAESIALNMYRQGADIIYHAAGGSGNGLFKAAKDLNKLAIGVDSDQGLVYATAAQEAEKEMSKYILTSMLKRVDNSVFLTATAFMAAGKVAGGYRAFSLADGGVGYAVNDFNKDKLAGVTAKIDEIAKKIISGEIKVPDSDEKVTEWANATLK
ncbi:MAG: BMP family ABC transporter substrate-binding protein [Spirochaetota bacterium]